MDRNTPRIEAVAANGKHELLVLWTDGRHERIDLQGWIATGGDILSPLAALSVFRCPKVGDYGASVVWDWDGDELAIDTVHLDALAMEQRPFGAEEIVSWQDEMGLSNQEAADFLGVSPSTWHTYKTGAKIPPTVAMTCRASRRDPILFQAHYRPRKAGRPRRVSG